MHVHFVAIILGTMLMAGCAAEDAGVLAVEDTHTADSDAFAVDAEDTEDADAPTDADVAGDSMDQQRSGITADLSYLHLDPTNHDFTTERGIATVRDGLIDLRFVAGPLECETASSELPFRDVQLQILLDTEGAELVPGQTFIREDEPGPNGSSGGSMVRWVVLAADTVFNARRFAVTVVAVDGLELAVEVDAEFRAPADGLSFSGRVDATSCPAGAR